MADEGLVARLRNGWNMHTFKADYSSMLSEIKWRKAKEEKQAKALSKIKKMAKPKRESSKHKFFWKREEIRLSKLYRQLISNRTKFPGQRNLERDLETLSDDFARDFDKYKNEVISDVVAARFDMLNSPSSKNVSENFNRVSARIKTIIKELTEDVEQQLLELEDTNLTDPDTVQTGIPVTLQDFDAHNQKVKALIVEEILVLDAEFIQRLKDCDDDYDSCKLSIKEHWTEAENFLFKSILEQYKDADTPNAKILCQERLRLHFPKKQPFDLSIYEKALNDRHYYVKKRQSLLHDWKSARKDMVEAGLEIIQKHNAAMEAAEEDLLNRERQIQRCNSLHHKVRDMRFGELEDISRKHEENEFEQHHLLEEIELANADISRKRAQLHDELEHFREERHNLQEEEKKVIEHRLLEMQNELAELSVYNRQRVQYRETENAKKLELVVEREKLLEEEKLAKETRLETLRNQVRPTVAADPARARAHTVATDSKRHELDNEGFVEELFPLRTFTDTQITNDPRLRLENRLRDAGLHHLPYARQLLSKTAPLKPPRTGLESEIFKYQQ